MGERAIRMGNDIVVLWRIFIRDADGGSTPYPLDGRDLTLYVNGIAGRRRTEEFSAEGNLITWRFPGRDQSAAGAYSLTLVENEGSEGMHTVDSCEAFRLTSGSAQASCGRTCGSMEVYTVELTSVMALGMPGPAGLSAYQIAVQNGFGGTEEEWLASLKGEPGEPGKDGERGPAGQDGAPGADGQPGKDATVNGMNAVTLAGGGTVSATQDPESPERIILEVKDASLAPEKLDREYLEKSSVVDSLWSDSRDAPLSAAQGRALDRKKQDTIQPGGVGTDLVADMAITGDKIADNAVSTGKIMDSAVTGDKLAAESVTPAKLADGAVTPAKLAESPDLLTGAKDYTGAINEVNAKVDAIEVATEEDINTLFN